MYRGLVGQMVAQPALRDPTGDVRTTLRLRQTAGC